MHKKKCLLTLLLFFGVGALSWVQAQSPSLSEQSVRSSPVSLEPAIEKDGVRVALQTSLQKKDRLTVRVKISNLSENPVLVSPDAVEASTEEGFVIQPIGSKGSDTSKWKDSDSKNDRWSKISKVAALIPFSDPYRIVSSTRAIANFAQKNLASPPKKKFDGLLHELILQPGMATHGIINYDASSLKAFDYAPTLHIKVTVGSEPFEFKFASETRTLPRNN